MGNFFDFLPMCLTGKSKDFKKIRPCFLARSYFSCKYLICSHLTISAVSEETAASRFKYLNYMFSFDYIIYLFFEKIKLE